MDLINDLDTEIAFAIVMDERYRQKVDADDILALIDRIRTMRDAVALGLETNEKPRSIGALKRI